LDSKRALDRYEQVKQFFKIMLDDNDKVLKEGEARGRNFLKNQLTSAAKPSVKRQQEG